MQRPPHFLQPALGNRKRLTISYFRLYDYNIIAHTKHVILFETYTIGLMTLKRVQFISHISFSRITIFSSRYTRMYSVGVGVKGV